MYKVITTLGSVFSLVAYLVVTPLYAQTDLQNNSIQTMDTNLTLRDVRFSGERILVHLKVGHERAIVFPEPIELVDTQLQLPGSKIVIDVDVIGFYPQETFKRVNVRLLGLESGTVYVLGVRASTEGFLQPLRLVN